MVPTSTRGRVFQEKPQVEDYISQRTGRNVFPQYHSSMPLKKINSRKSLNSGHSSSYAVNNENHGMLIKQISHPELEKNEETTHHNMHANSMRSFTVYEASHESDVNSKQIPVFDTSNRKMNLLKNEHLQQKNWSSMSRLKSELTERTIPCVTSKVQDNTMELL